MVLKKNYRRRKGNSTAKLLIWLGVLIVIVFVGRYYLLKNKTPISNGQNATSTPITATTTASKSLLKLRDLAGIYEVSYPRGTFKVLSKSVGVPPEGSEKIKAQVLSHVIDVKHCGLSGLPEHCTPSTTDLAISFFVQNRSFNDIFGELKKIYGDLSVVTVDGHQGVSFDQGAEGEGMVYLVLPVNDSKTLFIGRSYINEAVVAGYKTAKGFIKFADQKAIFDQILSTFNFRPSF